MIMVVMVEMVMMVMIMMLGAVKFLRPAQRKTLVHMFCVFGEVQHLIHHLLHLAKMLHHHRHHPHPHHLHCHHRRCHDDLYYQVYEEKAGAYN